MTASTCTASSRSWALRSSRSRPSSRRVSTAGRALPFAEGSNRRSRTSLDERRRRPRPGRRQRGVDTKNNTPRTSREGRELRIQGRTITTRTHRAAYGGSRRGRSSSGSRRHWIGGGESLSTPTTTIRNFFGQQQQLSTTTASSRNIEHSTTGPHDLFFTAVRLRQPRTEAHTRTATKRRATKRSPPPRNTLDDLSGKDRREETQCAHNDKHRRRRQPRLYFLKALIAASWAPLEVLLVLVMGTDG